MYISLTKNHELIFERNYRGYYELFIVGEDDYWVLHEFNILDTLGLILSLIVATALAFLPELLRFATH